MKKYHYVYYSWEQWGRGYIGVRSCKCLPEEDKTYFGSFRDKTFFPTEKIILEVFESREKANQVEIKLHEFFNVGINPNFANRAKHKSSGFCVFGVPKSEEHKKKIGKANSQRLKGKPSSFKGKKHSEESLQKIRKSLKGRVLSEEHRRKLSGKNNPMYGKVPWENPSAKNNRDVWKEARELFEIWKNNNKPGVQKLRTLSRSNFTNSNLVRIHRKFKNGWNPFQDKQYLSWIDSLV